MSNNYWLHGQLADIANIDVDPKHDPVIVVSKDGVEHRIYTPNFDEYLVDIDIVQKAIELGATIVSYPSSWCKASREAISYGQQHHVKVVPHGKLFEMMKA